MSTQKKNKRLLKSRIISYFETGVSKTEVKSLKILIENFIQESKRKPTYDVIMHQSYKKLKKSIIFTGEEWKGGISRGMGNRWDISLYVLNNKNKKKYQKAKASTYTTMLVGIELGLMSPIKGDFTKTENRIYV